MSPRERRELEALRVARVLEQSGGAHGAVSTESRTDKMPGEYRAL